MLRTVNARTGSTTTGNGAPTTTSIVVIVRHLDTARYQTWGAVPMGVICRGQRPIVNVQAGEHPISSIVQGTIDTDVTYQHRRAVPSRTLVIVSTVVI